MAACALQSVTRLPAVTAHRPKTGNGNRTRLSYRVTPIPVSMAMRRILLPLLAAALLQCAHSFTHIVHAPIRTPRPFCRIAPLAPRPSASLYRARVGRGSRGAGGALALSSQEADGVQRLPSVEIEYCTGCRWMLRAAWLAQELLTT